MLTSGDIADTSPRSISAQQHGYFHLPVVKFAAGGLAFLLLFLLSCKLPSDIHFPANRGLPFAIVITPARTITSMIVTAASSFPPPSLPHSLSSYFWLLYLIQGTFRTFWRVRCKWNAISRKRCATNTAMTRQSLATLRKTIANFFYFFLQTANNGEYLWVIVDWETVDLADFWKRRFLTKLMSPTSRNHKILIQSIGAWSKKSNTRFPFVWLHPAAFR